MRAVCLLSGGIDSSTCAFYAKSEGYLIHALHINYGQRTESRERKAAKSIARLLEAEYVEVDIGYLSQFGGSSLTDHSIKVEKFGEDRVSPPNTYVPFRNANLLSIATSFAEARSADAIFIGAQAQDYSGYPDCRPEFIAAFQKVIDVGTCDDTRIRLLAPFVGMNKEQILTLGLMLGVPYAETWSCYQSDDRACGVCGACHFRLAAFKALGREDPISYREMHD